MSPQESDVVLVHCNECAHVTRHALIATRRQPGSQPYDEDIEITWETKYDMLECMGCENVCVRRSYWFSEAPEGSKITFYPPRVSRRTPVWANELTGDIGELLQELYAALHADSRRLAMMGARAIIDLVMKERVGDLGGFEQKLDAMVAAGYVSGRNRDVLAVALDAGHAASHRGHQASVEDTGLVIDIVENLLHTDLIERASAKLGASIPPRGTSPTKSSRSGS
jgi:hypothetical protein